MSIFHVLGFAATIVLIILVGVYSGRKVKDVADFTNGGGKAGAGMVCGAILGSLVSGQATLGTAQLAFQYGLAAWWFTLGSGIGCLILAIGYVIPMRHSPSTTLVQVITDKYGILAGYIGSVLSSIGIFISVIAQIISAYALLTTIFHMNVLTAIITAIVIMVIYVVFGGMWGAGMGGIVKLILLYSASIVGCILVLNIIRGLNGITDELNKLLLGTSLGSIIKVYSKIDISAHFYNLVARGRMKDIGSGISLIVGVLSTQTYAQAIWSARNDSSARKGALLSAILIPPIGIACIIVGLFMRNHCITAAEVEALKRIGASIPQGLMVISSSAQVFPAFILQYMPPLFGGVVLGTLLITIVGGGAGLSLGVATIIVNDIMKKFIKELSDVRTSLVVTRITLLCVLIAAGVVAAIVPGAVINDFGFLSMGLRGAVIFLPVTFALYYKAKIRKEFIVASMSIGPIIVIAGNLVNVKVDPLILGMGVSLVCILIGMIVSKKIYDE